MTTSSFQNFCTTLTFDEICNLFDNLQDKLQFIGMSWLPNPVDRIQQEKDKNDTLAKLYFLADLIEKLE
jgi:hypothetical protein